MRIKTLVEDIKDTDICTWICFSNAYSKIFIELKEHPLLGGETIELISIKNISEVISMNGFLEQYKKFRDTAENELEAHLRNVYSLTQKTILRNRLKETLYYIEDNLTDEQKLYLECIDV